MKKHIFVAFGLLLAFLIMGCEAEAESIPEEETYTVLTEATLEPGDEIPVPTGPVILTLSGKINHTNVDDTLQFDMETLEKLGLVEYSVDDRLAEGRVVTFQGVLMSDLLAVAGAADDATRLDTIALNDYMVEIPLEDFEKYPVLLATSVDGERMPVERYGPTRIIYPYASFDLDEAIYDARWIWQLDKVEVR